MAITYGFYNSLNKDRVYNAEQMSSIFNGIITDGVFSTIGDALMPIAGTGMQAIVKTGKCWFNSTWTLNDALLPLDIEAADVSLTRIDAIVVEINSSIGTRANTIKMLKGTPSANPAKPALANSEHLHQYALGYVTVSAGVTSITADKIEVNVGKATCPFITSVLQQTDITDLFNQWDAEFSAWFANVQSQLSGDIAANLQRQIDEIRISDSKKLDAELKANRESVYLGESDSAYITPASLGTICDRIGDIKFTTRSSIGDDWLLANGANFDISDYPDLAAYMSAGQDKFTNFTKRTDLEAKYPLCNIGNYEVVFFDNGYYATKNFGAWVKKDAGTDATIRSISFINGRYLLLRVKSGKYSFGWTDDLYVLPSQWVTPTNGSGYFSDISPVSPIRKLGNYYVGTYFDADHSGNKSKYSDGIIYSTDLVTWTVAILTSRSTHQNSVLDTFYLNGKYVILEYSTYTHYISVYVYADINLTNRIASDLTLGSSSRFNSWFCDGSNVYCSSENEKYYFFKYFDPISLTIVDISDKIPGKALFAPGNAGCYVLNSNKQVYNVTKSVVTLLGTINSGGNILFGSPNGNQFYYSDSLIAYLGTDKYFYGGFRNVLPNITAPSGTKAFIKAKAIS